METIDNIRLRIEDIPLSALDDKIARFAHSFNGYEYAPCIQTRGDIAKKVRAAINSGDTESLTLSEVRASLFYYFRSLRHDIGIVSESEVDPLLRLIRTRVVEGRLD